MVVVGALRGRDRIGRGVVAFRAVAGLAGVVRVGGLVRNSTESYR